MRKIALIGYGAIGASIVELWPRVLGARAHLACVLARLGQIEEVKVHVSADTLVTADSRALLDMDVDVVVEAAGHQAVHDLAEAVLRRGIEFQILSAGALADTALRGRIESAATVGGARLIVLAGALAGFDGLLSMRASKLTSVKYTSIKPCAAWRGTPAEAHLPGKGDNTPKTVFIGSAADVCRAYPKNANLAAAVALAGVGFERTVVELVADPRASQNSGRVEAKSDVGDLDLTLIGNSFGENPKSSRITALSAIAALHDAGEAIAFR